MRGLSMAKWLALPLTIVIGLGASAREGLAQSVAETAFSNSYRTSDYFLAPGWYGTSYGFASYGMPQTYSVFSAYPGPSYGTNYAPYGLMPGRYGVGLWRPGYVAPGYVYGASYYPASGFSYRTFPITHGAPSSRTLPPPPSIGVYAPALGPAPLYGW